MRYVGVGVGVALAMGFAVVAGLWWADGHPLTAIFCALGVPLNLWLAYIWWSRL